MASSVILPPELEYEIFMFALQNEVTDPGTLLLVAKRVYDWLIPHIYQTVIIHPLRIYPPDITSASVISHGHHTRHLFVEYEAGEEDQIIELLSHCPNISNLALWRDDSEIGQEIESIVNLDHVTGLSLDLVQFKDVDLEEDDTALKTEYQDDPELQERLIKVKRKCLAFFSRVTHLVILADVDQSEDVVALKYFTSLTHLCVPASIVNQALAYVVQTCQRLEVVVLLAASDDEDKEILYFHKDVLEVAKGVDKEWEDLEEQVGELRGRVVPVLCRQYLAGWEKWARGGEDMWTVAEKAIRGRAAKE
ncbi:hypothetical protein BDN72DRAFT_961229 [Pluteus cervinus]|uniref:Uncharacterized protein n=1 Tax=Pluteus cervinus TaxID=181527 RepID=A0ACD3AQI3_9AGAR|nr:hypothetical protein BDN72DRAFT_961229 [Pluteus cervinus]